MNLTLSRNYFRENYIIGKLFIEDDYFCDTLELPFGSCVPAGSYPLVLNIRSPKFSRKWFYRQVCNGFVPRLLNVPGHEGILIHCGNSVEDSSGCILIGKNEQVGKVLHSMKYFQLLYKRLFKSADSININIINCPLDKNSHFYYDSKF